MEPTVAPARETKAPPRAGEHALPVAQAPDATDVGAGPVVACLDLSTAGEGVLPHAIGIARCFRARLNLLHVLEPAVEAADGPADPYTWELRAAEAREYLLGLAVALSSNGVAI